MHGAEPSRHFPATFGVLTTIVAFMPLLMISGFAAAFTESIGWVVILCLIFSLIESKLILPSHLVHFGKPNEESWFNKIPKRANAKLEDFVHTYYVPSCAKCIDNRYITLSTFIGMFIVATSLLAGGIVRVVFLPEIPSDFVQASVTMVEGSPESQTRAIMNKLEDAALSMNGQFQFKDVETGEMSTEVVDHVIIVGNNADLRNYGH